MSTRMLLATARKTGRYCTGNNVLTILDVVDAFPALHLYAQQYHTEIEIYQGQSTYPITPKTPMSMAEVGSAVPGTFLRLPKQYRRFFGMTDKGWRSFKGFDPLLGLRLANGDIDIRRGCDSPWGMKWLSGQIYTSILAWAIHNEHIRQYKVPAPLPMPVVIADVKKVFLDGRLTPVEEIPLAGNRSYPWLPGKTEFCQKTRRQIVQEWIDALPNANLADVICRHLKPETEGLGGAIYDMEPMLRLEMPAVLTPNNRFQHANYCQALERPLTEIDSLASDTTVTMKAILQRDDEASSCSRAVSLGTLLAICRELKINMLSFGVEASNIAIDGSLPDLDTLQFRKDSMEWDITGGLPATVHFRFSGVHSNLCWFERFKGEMGMSRLSDSQVSKNLRIGLGEENPETEQKHTRVLTPTETMHLLDGKLTAANTLQNPAVPNYILEPEMPWPSGITFLRCLGTDNSPAEVWFTLARVGEFIALEVHHRSREGEYNRLPGDYFHHQLSTIPRSFFNYLEEYIRLFLSSGVSQVIFYPEHMV